MLLLFHVCIGFTYDRAEKKCMTFFLSLSVCLASIFFKFDLNILGFSFFYFIFSWILSSLVILSNLVYSPHLSALLIFIVFCSSSILFFFSIIFFLLFFLCVFLYWIELISVFFFFNFILFILFFLVIIL